MYKSTRDAEMDIGVKKEYIMSACRGELITAGGYFWAYKGNTPMIRSRNTRIKNNKKVVMYKNFVKIKIFNNSAEAAHIMKLPLSNIQTACKKNNNWLVGGYQWAYESDGLNMKIPSPNETGMQKYPCCYDKNGILIKMFYSTSEAGKYYNLGKRNIARACSSRNKMLLGMYWAYRGYCPIIN